MVHGIQKPRLAEVYPTSVPPTGDGVPAPRPSDRESQDPANRYLSPDMARRKRFNWYFGIASLILGWPVIVEALAVNFLPMEEPHFKPLRNKPAASWYSFGFVCVVISTSYRTIVLSHMRKKKR